MNTLRVRLLGKMTLARDERRQLTLDGRKAQALLGYLLIFRGKPHAREELSGLFWGERSPRSSKKNLRQTLWQLQSVLGEEDQDGEPSFFQADNEWVQINPAVDFWLDVAELEEAYNQVYGIPGKDLIPSQNTELQEVVKLYRGDLLVGCYQDWCLLERERLRHMYLSLLDKILGYSEAHGEYEKGLTYGVSILRYDRAREHTHRRLMRLYYLAGKRSEALRQYQRCVKALDEELGVAPSKLTQQLYRQLENDSLPPQAGEAQPQNFETPDLEQVLSQLNRLREYLGEVRHRVGDDIQAIERVLQIKR